MGFIECQFVPGQPTPMHWQYCIPFFASLQVFLKFLISHLFFARFTQWNLLKNPQLSHIIVRDQLDYNNLRPTDSITMLLNIGARTHLPLTTLVVNFMDIFNYARDSQGLQVSDKDQFSAIGPYLEERG